MTLTDGQITMLRAAAKPNGVSKAQVASHYWRNLDQLERRGLITNRGFLYYFATDLGRVELGPVALTEAGYANL